MNAIDNSILVVDWYYTQKKDDQLYNSFQQWGTGSIRLGSPIYAIAGRNRLQYHPHHNGQ